MTRVRLTVNEIDVLRQVKEDIAPLYRSRNATIGRNNTLQSLRVRGMLDSKFKLTAEGARVLEDQSR